MAAVIDLFHSDAPAIRWGSYHELIQLWCIWQDNGKYWFYLEYCWDQRPAENFSLDTNYAFNCIQNWS